MKEKRLEKEEASERSQSKIAKENDESSCTVMCAL
jgi:hypothetical protein